MGRYSDSDDYYSSSTSKKKSKKSRSRSKSSESSYVSSRRIKHKKSKKSKKSKKASHSRSPSYDYYKSSKSKSRRSRSRSKDRRRSRSRSQSRSRDKRRSRSRSQSWSKRRSRSSSRSRSKYSRRSRSRSRGKSSRSRRSRSHSHDRRDRSRSQDNLRRSRSHSESREENRVPKIDPCASIPGFSNLSATEQAEVRLQMALKAAAAADEKLKEQGVLQKSGSAVSLTFEEQQKRVAALEDIEADDFKPAMFKSSRDQRPFSTKTAESTHDSAIFGTGTFDIKPSNVPRVPLDDPRSYMHPDLFVSAEEKMKRWIEKLTAMRRNKLEGKAME